METTYKKYWINLFLQKTSPYQKLHNYTSSAQAELGIHWESELGIFHNYLENTKKKEEIFIGPF